MKQLIIMCLVGLCMAGCQEAKVEEEIKPVSDLLANVESSILNPQNILTHIDALSSDDFQGRKPCTEGEIKTVDYLTKALKKIGVEGANNGKYTQDVPLLDIVSNPGKVMEIHSDLGTLDFLRQKDFVIHSQRKTDAVELKNSDLIFCGFGVVAPELGWNDYEGIDMKGKTAVVLANDPDFGMEGSNQFFRGDTMTYYGRWDYKYAEADRQGADGLLIIHETASAGYPWFVVQSSWSGSQQGLSAVDRSNDCAVKGWISFESAKRLFDISQKDMGAEIRASRQKEFVPIPFSANANVKIENDYTECVSQNVVGWIKGSKYPDEYVIYTAHWDHLGIGTAVEGDSIYNGALDNASGVAALLGIAEKFSQPENRPERSVVFLFVTAEEQGLLGTEHYINYPLFPIEKTVCNLNLDGINPSGPMKDLTVTGLGYSEMDAYAEKYAKMQGRYIQAEQEPEKGLFFRSDHFYFVREGVPAFYGEGGYDHKEKGKEYAMSIKKSYTNERYHAPSDELDPNGWDLRGFIEDAEIYYQIGAEISNNRDWPKWKKGSEFSREAVEE